MVRGSERILDEYLGASAIAGDALALERLISRWQPRLVRHAWRVLGDIESARDAVQEAWMSSKGWQMRFHLGAYAESPSSKRLACLCRVDAPLLAEGGASQRQRADQIKPEPEPRSRRPNACTADSYCLGHSGPVVRRTGVHCSPKVSTLYSAKCAPAPGCAGCYAESTKWQPIQQEQHAEKSTNEREHAIGMDSSRNKEHHRFAHEPESYAPTLGGWTLGWRSRRSGGAEQRGGCLS